MKSLISFILLFCVIALFSQEGCKRPKPYKNYSFIPNISSESAGVFPNAYHVPKRNLQIETNGLAGAFNNKYEQAVYAGFIQLRYGFHDYFEAHFKVNHINPPELNADSLFQSYVGLGLKFKLLKLERNRLNWDLALAFTTFLHNTRTSTFLDSTGEGIDFTLSNSFKINRFVYLDVSTGIIYYELNTSLYGKLSTKIMLKKEYSKLGVYMGINGDNRYESMINIGLHISNNTNYILELSISMLDKAISPNFSYAYRFGN